MGVGPFGRIGVARGSMSAGEAAQRDGLTVRSAGGGVDLDGLAEPRAGLFVLAVLGVELGLCLQCARQAPAAMARPVDLAEPARLPFEATRPSGEAAGAAPEESHD